MANNLNSDIYSINEYINQIKKDFTPDVNEDSLMLGIFGYMGQVFSDTMQNTIVMASEFSNESIATKAKFEKNVIAHALGLGITDINAIPATFDVLLIFLESDIEKYIDPIKHNKGTEFDWTFTFDKDIPIYVGDYEFHTDYDILLKKVEIPSSDNKHKYAYTASYDIDIDNPISDITNPYLPSPVRMNINGEHAIFTQCTLRQVKKQTIHKKVLSDNSISAKTVTFEFEGQIAAFTIDVKEGDTTTHLIPVYEGLSVEDKEYPYFYYCYLDSNTIRIKFDRNSYAPRINSDVQINLQLTEGESGNFKYNQNAISFSAESEKYGYSNISCEIAPVTGESLNGTNKKSVEDLKKLIPKEALSRGSITNLSDLENYFNMLDNDNSILYFYKKRDNALERLYYSFIIMKDAYDVIIPTNTIDIDIEKVNDSEYKQVIKRNQCFKLSEDGKGIEYNGNISEISEADDLKDFYYVIPYDFVINLNPLYGIYLLTTIDTKKFLDFSFINDQCIYQYIATSIYIKRGYYEDPKTYKMTIDLKQNIDTDNADADKSDINSVRCIALFYNENNEVLRWAEGKVISRDFVSNVFKYQFSFDTDDRIDINNKININTGIYDTINAGLESSSFIGNDGIIINKDAIFIDADTAKDIPENVSRDYYIMINNNKIYEYISESWAEYTPEDNSYIMINKTGEDNIQENLLYVYKKSEDGSNGSWSEPDVENGSHILINSIVYSYNNGKWDPSYSYANFNGNCKCVLYVISKQDGQDRGLDGLDKIVPNLAGYSVSNEYTIKDGVDFFYDYSDIVNSIISVRKDKETNKEIYTIRNVPVVKYDYFDKDDDSKAIEFCKELVRRKNYIDYAIQVLEDAFGMDFKFFNTYGPSKLFTIDNGKTYLNRTNLSLTFNLKLKANYDTNITNDIIADIKDYIEDINNISTIHMSNLIAYIISKYSNSIEFFEFVDMNEYSNPAIQHLYSMGMPDELIVPEFVNVMARKDGSPDINLILV